MFVKQSTLKRIETDLRWEIGWKDKVIAALQNAISNSNTTIKHLESEVRNLTDERDEAWAFARRELKEVEMLSEDMAEHVARMREAYQWLEE